MIEGLESELKDVSAIPQSEDRSEPDAGSDMIYFVGGALAVFGAILMFIGVMKSGAPEYSDTLNIGLLNDKSNLVTAGGFVATWGIVLIGAGYVSGRIARAFRQENRR